MRPMIPLLALLASLAACDQKPETAKPAPTPQAAPASEPKETPKPEPKAEQKATDAMNDICPVTGDTVDPKFTAKHEGRTIAFCCEHCLREFNDADEKGKAEIAAKLK